MRKGFSTPEKYRSFKRMKRQLRDLEQRIAELRYETFPAVAGESRSVGDRNHRNGRFSEMLAAHRPLEGSAVPGGPAAHLNEQGASPQVSGAETTVVMGAGDHPENAATAGRPHEVTVRNWTDPRTAAGHTDGLAHPVVPTPTERVAPDSNPNSRTVDVRRFGRLTAKAPGE
jgi:hypothetical protein